MMNSRLSHLAARAVQRRSMSTPAAPRSDFPPLEKMMLKENYEAKQHAVHAVSSWKKINYFLVAPALALVCWYVIPSEVAHINHLKEHANEFEPFPYLRKRKNPFPWGDDNLFYFPNSNPKPAPEE
ncbi:cytochrome c oxidase, subunit VIa [Phlyctochytrium arcticum]|nr:cytochrome c oxidase, subunit VIa [Phlyctochytrium arcticum]